MAFLDCNIWEINQFPKYGVHLDRYTLANVFQYRSDVSEYQSNNFYIQIPEFEINGTDEQKSFINKYKEKLIQYRIPFLINRINRGMESWVIDLSMSDYLLHKITKET
jgi:hypothetical protein